MNKTLDDFVYFCSVEKHDNLKVEDKLVYPKKHKYDHIDFQVYNCPNFFHKENLKIYLKIENVFIKIYIKPNSFMGDYTINIFKEVNGKFHNFYSNNRLYKNDLNSLSKFNLKDFVENVDDLINHSNKFRIKKLFKTSKY